MSEQEYLKSELSSDVKHEYIDGQAYAMAGGTENHNLITGNISRKFGNHLKNSHCKTFASDMMISAGNDKFYPDVVVVCDKHAPRIIVEVFSKSTLHLDKGKKLLQYINIPSLKEYVMIEQNVTSIDVLRKSEGWIPRNYTLGENIHFESIDLTLSVEEIYHRVENEDMTKFLETNLGIQGTIL